MPAVTRKDSYSVINSSIVDADVKMSIEQFYRKGTIHLVTEEIERYMSGIQSWV